MTSSPSKNRVWLAGILTRTFSGLNVRNYRLFFVGQGISLIGTWMQTIGQSWLVLRLTGSGTAIGLVVALQFLPMLFLAPVGGVVADRVDKRKMLYITQSMMGVLALILAVLVSTGIVKLWMVYLLAFGFGLLNSFDNPLRQSFIREMAGAEELTNAVALNSTEVNIARLIGPAVAGVLIETVGLAFCFFINAGSFLAVLIALSLMRTTELHTAKPNKQAKGQLLEGFRYVLNTPILRDVLIMMAIIGTLAYEFQVSLPLMSKFTFHGNAASYAMLTSAMAAGAIAGGLMTATRRKIGRNGLIIAAVGFGIAILATAAAPNLIAAAVAMVVVGIFSINFTALSNSILQLESVHEMRGRVMSLWAVTFMGSTPVGGPIIGLVSQQTNPRWGLAIGGIAALVAAVFAVVAGKYRAAVRAVGKEPIDSIEPLDLSQAYIE